MSNTTHGQGISQLGRYTEMNYILLGDLREALDSSLGLAERNWLLSILDALLQSLPAQFSLKEEGGYMEEVLDAFPYWDRQVEQLRSEHAPLVETLTVLRGRIATGSEFKQVAQIVKDDLADWMERLFRHESRECRLFQNAMNVEVGVGD